MTIKLTQLEMTTGLILNRSEQEAQTVLNERKQAHNLFVAFLRDAHGAPADKYDLDWVQGFIEKPAEAPKE